MDTLCWNMRWKIPPFFTYEVSVADGKTIRLPDNEAIQLAHQKIEQIRSGFINWLNELPDAEKKNLESLVLVPVSLVASLSQVREEIATYGFS